MNAEPPPAVSFDPRPLTEPVDRAASRAFAQQLRAQGRIPGLLGSNVVGLLVVSVFGIVVIFFVLTTFLTVLGAFISSDIGGPGFALIGLLPPIGIGVVVTIGALLAIRNLGARRDRMFRLDRFARANGMSYAPSMPAPALPGVIFGIGSSRQAMDLVRGDQPRFVEFANYRYTTGSGKERTTHTWGYVAVKLDVPLPNIVLDATSNNGVFGGSNLPASLDKAQRLSLEGDFDRFFTLYCPAGYERDALYLFTPDIMARFIDNAASLDIEIVDDWLFLYARRDLSTLDPATWAWLFSAVGALLGKFAQWARWRDDRLAQAPAAQALPTASAAAAATALPFVAPPQLLRPPPGVAAPGRRLKRGFPWGAIVVVSVFVAFWLAMQFGVFGIFLNLLR